jgi:hypothetical protein
MEKREQVKVLTNTGVWGKCGVHTWNDSVLPLAVVNPRKSCSVMTTCPIWIATAPGGHTAVLAAGPIAMFFERSVAQPAPPGGGEGGRLRG